MRRTSRLTITSSAILLGAFVLLVSGCRGAATNLSPASLFVKPTRIIEDHETKTDDDWTLALKRYRRAGANPLLGPVVLTHGFSYSGAFWDLDEAHSLAGYLADRNFDVWVVSLRGAGASTKPGFSVVKSAINTRLADLPATIMRTTIDPAKFDWTVDDYIDHDVPAILSAVTRFTGRPKVWWVGHSMGGMIILSYLERSPRAPVAGVVAVGSPMTIPQPPNDLLQGVLDNSGLLKISALAVNTTLPAKLTSPLGGRVQTPLDKLFYNRENMDPPTITTLFLNVEDVPTGVLDQFTEMIRTGEFKRADGSYNYTRNLGRITVPLLLIAGQVDNIAPPEVMRFSYDQVASADKTFRTFGRTGGYMADYGHNDLILGKQAREEVFPLISTWLSERAGGYR